MELSAHAYKIKELRKKKQFNEALIYYKKNIDTVFSKTSIKQNQWLVADMMYCLRKIDNPDKAIHFFIGYLKITPDKIEILRLKSELGWSLFALIQGKHRLPYLDLLATDYLKILDQATDGILFTALYWKLIAIELSKIQPNTSLIYQSLDKIKPENLSNNPQKFNTNIKGREKEIILASDAQRWYIEMSKILFLTKNYAGCVKCIENGFEKISNFKTDAEFWLLRRKYHALAGLGEHETAIWGLKELINKKNDWFLFKDLAEIYYSAKDEAQSLICASIACLLPGKADYKVSLFAFMSEKLLHNNLQSTEHKLIACHIRQKNKWKIPAADEEIFAQAHQIGQCIKHSVEFWINHLIEKNMMQPGKIIKILHQGSKGDGFIEYAEGKHCYFRMPDIIGLLQNAEEGSPVYFLLKQSCFKGKKSDQAYAILLKDNMGKISGLNKILVI